MVSLPVLEPREVAALLVRLGFQEVRQRGSHRQYRHPNGRGTTVPFHAGRDISPTWRRKIARDIGITVEELLQGIQLVGLHLLDLRDIQVNADEVFPARCLNPMGSCQPCPKVGPPAAVCYDSTPTRRIGQRWGATRAPTWASDGGAGPFGVLPFV